MAAGVFGDPPKNNLGAGAQRDQAASTAERHRAQIRRATAIRREFFQSIMRGEAGIAGPLGQIRRLDPMHAWCTNINCGKPLSPSAKDATCTYCGSRTKLR